MAIEQIDKGLKSGQPFWAGVAPTGPHFRFPGYSFGLPVFPPEVRLSCIEFSSNLMHIL